MQTILTMTRLAALAIPLCACSGQNGTAPELGAQRDLAVRRDLAVPMDASTCSPPDAGGKTCPIFLPEVLVTGGAGQIGGVSYKVGDFYLDVYEVTVGAYRMCTQGGPCTQPDSAQDNSANCNWTSTAGSRESQPINCVDWTQARTFCDWAGRRLPAEGEWAFAAFGPTGAMSSYPWGDAAPIATASDAGLPQLCWDQSGGTCSTGSFPKTLLGSTTSSGVADLAGNVWEWTNGQFNDTYIAPEMTCTTSCSIRGGSWSDDFPSIFGPTERNNFLPTDRLDNVGFRCAR